MIFFVKENRNNSKPEEVELDKIVPIIVSKGMKFIEYNSLSTIDGTVQKALYNWSRSCNIKPVDCEIPICYVTLELPVESVNKYISINNGFWSEMKQTNYISSSYIDLFILNKRKYLATCNSVKKTLLCFTGQMFMICHSSGTDMDNKTREEFLKEQMILGLDNEGNIFEDLDIIHFPLYVAISGGHYCLLSVAINDRIITISESFCKSIQPQHQDAVSKLVCYMREYERKVCYSNDPSN